MFLESDSTDKFLKRLAFISKQEKILKKRKTIHGRKTAELKLFQNPPWNVSTSLHRNSPKLFKHCIFTNYRHFEKSTETPETFRDNFKKGSEFYK